jgi:hypothetical protein
MSKVLRHCVVVCVVFACLFLSPLAPPQVTPPAADARRWLRSHRPRLPEKSQAATGKAKSE